jgi:hypothetical protein
VLEYTNKSLSVESAYLGHASLSISAIHTIVPRVKDNLRLVKTEAGKLLVDIRVGHDNAGRLGQLGAVDGAMEVPRKFLMLDNLAIGDINHSLEQTRSTLDVPNGKDASGKQGQGKALVLRIEVSDQLLLGGLVQTSGLEVQLDRREQLLDQVSGPLNLVGCGRVKRVKIFSRHCKDRLRMAE